MEVIINILGKICGQMNVNCFKISGHIGFANLVSFHHMDISGLLVHHSRDLSEKNCSEFFFGYNLLEVDPKIEVDYLD